MSCGHVTGIHYPENYAKPIRRNHPRQFAGFPVSLRCDTFLILCPMAFRLPMLIELPHSACEELRQRETLGAANKTDANSSKTNFKYVLWVLNQTSACVRPETMK